MRAHLTCDDPALTRNPRILRMRVAGVPLLRRHLLAFRQAGIFDVDIEAPSDILPEVEELARLYSPDGMTVHAVAQPAKVAGPVLHQSALTLVDPRLIAQLARMADGDGVGTPGPTGRCVGLGEIECRDDPAAPSDVRAKSPYAVGVPGPDEAQPVADNAGEGLAAVGLFVRDSDKGRDPGAGRRQVLHVGRYYWHRIEAARDRRTATWKVLLATMKATDGIYARTNRRVSLRISRLLLNTPVTPNMVTGATFAFGLLAGWLMAQGRYQELVAGSLVGWFASMLDGVDGELARAKFQASALGHWLEMVCDYAFYITLAIGLGVGIHRATGHRVWLMLGLAAAVGMVFCFTAVARLKRTYERRGTASDFYCAYQRSATASATSRFMRFTPHLTSLVTRASFPYFFVVFAVLGLAKVVLIIFAVATQLFWVGALFASRLEMPADR